MSVSDDRMQEIEAELEQLLDEQLRDTHQYKVDLAAAHALRRSPGFYATLTQAYERRNVIRTRKMAELVAELRE
jgi:hypothetical protein